MKKHNWDSRMSKIKPWVDTLTSSDIKQAIQLSIQLGDYTDNEDSMTKYWNVIRSIGADMEGFPNQFKPKLRGPRDGGLRKEFREKLHNVSSLVKDKGSVIYNDGRPSLENITVKASFCDNEMGLEKERKIRQICAEYNLKDKNIHIHLRDCSPKRKIGRYERTGRSGAYQGGNRWEPGN